MATGTAVASMDQHGAVLTDADAKSLQQFYHSLFRLQDDVFAGQHPRIKLPDNVMSMIAKVKHDATVLNRGVVATNKQNVSSNATLSALLPGLGVSQSQIPASVGSKPMAMSTSSLFDPILLTKSDELVSAEITMKRQRIEQVLADQVTVSKSSFNARNKDFAVDYETHLNVDEVLERVLRVIPHQSAFEDAEKSESFDENDYYSSQAMSWSTEHTDADGAEPVKPAAQQPAAPPPTQGALQPVPSTALPAEYDDLPDNDDEDDYSPPPPDAMPGTTDSDSTPNHQGPAPASTSRKTQAYDSRYEYNRPPQPPANPSAVIHSHIREPLMPQPARVSPLAYGKMPALGQAQAASSANLAPQYYPQQQLDGTAVEPTNNGSLRERSPVPAKETMKVQKKRKRKEERAAAREEKRSKRDAARQAPRDRQAASPDPYIKPEPTSPPPFASFTDMPPPPRRHAAEYAPEDVQVLSPRDPRTRQTLREYADYPPPPPGYRYAEPISPQSARVYSPGPRRRVERDDRDLRRVASLQYARRPISPNAPYAREDEPPSPAIPQQRAASYAYYDDHSRPLTSMVREPVHRYSSVAPPRYMRSRSRSPIRDGRASPMYAPRRIDRPDYGDGIERIASPAMMPPPSVPTRVVEDSYGNRYYATPAPPDAIPEMRVRESVAPPSRYYDDYPPPPSRQIYERPSTRASMMPPPSSRFYAEDMPPPQSAGPVPQRRREEDPAVEAYRSYRQRESSMRPPESRNRDVYRDDRYRDDRPPPAATSERPSTMDASQGRRIVSYDDSRPAPSSQYQSAQSGYGSLSLQTAPRAYSVRPDLERSGLPGDVAMSQHGRDIPSYGITHHPHMAEASEGRRIVSYDDNPPLRQELTPAAPGPPSGYATMPRAYSVRPDMAGSGSYPDSMALQRGRDISRHGTAQPQVPHDHIVQMPWERNNGHPQGGQFAHGSGVQGGHNPFASGMMPQFPPAQSREGRWVEVDEGHGGGRRVLPNGEVDEGYGGGERVIYHM